MSWRMKEWWQLRNLEQPLASGSQEGLDELDELDEQDEQDEQEDADEIEEACAPTSRTVAALPARQEILDHWHKVLISDDVESMRTADVRMPQKKFFWNDHAKYEIGYGDVPTAALAFLTTRAVEKARKSKAASAEPATGSDSIALPDSADGADQEAEAAPQDLRIPMALVLHKVKKDPVRATWPDPKRAKPPGSDKPKLNPLKLNIVAWFPFELDTNGAVCLPRNGLDRWPRFVRQWLEPQPLSASKDLPNAIGHYDDYQKALGKFFREVDGSVTFSAYAKACEMFCKDLQQEGEASGLTALGVTQWIAVERNPGYATLALNSVYKALQTRSATDTLGALGQLIGADQQTIVVDPRAQPVAASVARHVAMVDKAKVGSPDLERTADPLNPSQRRALHNLIELGDDTGIIAVSGPPGTGKTAMLRAMIANQWVLAALDDKPECPVTLVCGATNQSVENVMGTFDGAVSDSHPYARRWLKRNAADALLGFTASAPSSGKINKHLPLFTVIEIGKNPEKDLLLKGVGVPEGFSHIATPDDAFHWAKCFDDLLFRTDQKPLTELLFTAEQKIQVGSITGQLRKVMNAFKSLDKNQSSANTNATPKPSINEVAHHLTTLTQILRGGLVAAVDRQNQVLRSSRYSANELKQDLPSGHWTTKWALAGLQELQNSDDDQQKDTVRHKLVDVVWRPVAFHLAARYWEARWLLASLQTTAGRSRTEQLRSLAMLFPCIVSTLHSAPRLLKENDQPLFDFLDLLIIDEAGQAAPELGVPVLSLAHKAVIVGDMKQLAPVSAVTEEVDARNVADRWSNAASVLAQLQARGADAATGSIMKLAATGASRAELAPNGKIRDGLLLREHYRCARSIINVCIDLLYHDHDRDLRGALIERELIPVIPDPRPGDLADADIALLDAEQERHLLEQMKDTFPLPPLAFYQTGGTNDEPVKQESWSNPGEVEAIVRWLQTQGRQLAKWTARAAGRPGESADLASLVAIVTPFRGQAKAIKESIKKHLDGDDPGLSERMTVGTVHTLQGAEKPVVLFSAVNKDSLAIKRTADNHRERVFIDRDDGRLLNVAISRAQKSFILFGHSDLFFSHQALNPNNDLPSAIVGRCLAGVREAAHEALTGAPRHPARKLGPTTLMIVESAHKAGIIQALLNDDTQVFGCGGHIRELAGAGAISLEDGLKPHWLLSGREGENLQLPLQRAANRLLQCDELILGTDDDAQGEAIAWHLLQVLQEAPWFAHVKRVRRVRFHALTAPELQRAIDHGQLTELSGADNNSRAASALKALNMGLAYGALAMRVLDNLIGTVYGGLGLPRGGRVKGPLLRALAGYGDDPGAPEGRFGIAVKLLVDGQPTPARLMLSRAGGHWNYWGSDHRGATKKLLKALADAQVGPEPCLVEHQTRALAPADDIGTNRVLQEAFKRFGWLPSHTQRVLQGLYEKKPASPDTLDPLPAPGNTDAWATLNADGRFVLSTYGKARARKLRSSELKTISAHALLRQLDQALGELSQCPDAQPEDYQTFLRTWAARFDGQRAHRYFDLDIRLPDGPTIDREKVEIRMFDEQPQVARSAWQAVSVAPLRSTETTADLRASERKTEEPDRVVSPPQDNQDAGSRDGAHGALVPLSIDIDRDHESMALYSEAQKQLYDLMQKLALASVLRDGSVHTTRRIYPLSWPDKETVRPVEIGLEVITAVPGDYRGWFDIDPEGLQQQLKHWGDADIEQLLVQQTPPPTLLVQVIDNAIRTRSLLEPTVDRLLAWMEAHGLGRPSTFGAHIEGLLQGQALQTAPGADE